VDYNSYPAGAPLCTREDFLEICSKGESLKSQDPNLVEQDIEILFNSKDLSLQNKAARRLGLVGDIGWKYTVSWLKKAADDDDRYNDINFRNIGFISNIDRLNEVQTNIDLLKDEDKTVRAGACMSLCDLRASRSEEPLIEALRDEEAEVRASAAEALQWIGNERAVEPLIEVALNDNETDVRLSAIRSLGWIGDKRAIKPFKRLLKDEDEEVRRDAGDALKDIKRKNSKEE